MEFGGDIDDLADEQNFRSLTQTIMENNIDHFLSEGEETKAISQIEMKSNNMSMTTSNLMLNKLNSTHLNH